VVLKERLYPRGLVDGPTTEPGYRAYETYTKERTYHHGQQVHTQFLPHNSDDE
jgi:hypothetical protein